MGRLRDIFNGPFDLKNKDWIFLILALVLSATVWTLHNLSLKYSVYMSVPVAAQCEGLEGYATQSSENEVVVAKCRATGFDILSGKLHGRNNPKEVKIEKAALKAHPSGSFYLTGKNLVDYTTVFFGSSAHAEYYVTDTVFFHFPRRDFKKVPVEFLASLDFASQYVQSAPIELVPDSVLVYADPTRLEHIHAVQTQFLRLTQMNKNFSGVVKLKIPSSTRLSVGEVGYSIPVSRSVERIFTLPVKIKNIPEGVSASLSVEEVKLVANCRFPLVEGVGQQLTAYIDYEDVLASPSRNALVELELKPTWIFSYRLEPPVINCSK